MYNKEGTLFGVTNVCGPKAIFSSTFFWNLIFTTVHLYNKLMDPNSRQFRTEASTALAVVMRKFLGEKWCELSYKTMSYKVRSYLLHSTNVVTDLVFFKRTVVSVIILLFDISIRKVLLEYTTRYIKCKLL
jgi:hypothetical protein